jgi:hypothetical protein
VVDRLRPKSRYDEAVKTSHTAVSVCTGHREENTRRVTMDITATEFSIELNDKLGQVRTATMHAPIKSVWRLKGNNSENFYLRKYRVMEIPPDRDNLWLNVILETVDGIEIELHILPLLEEFERVG